MSNLSLIGFVIFVAISPRDGAASLQAVTVFFVCLLVFLVLVLDLVTTVVAFVYILSVEGNTCVL